MQVNNLEPYHCTQVCLKLGYPKLDELVSRFPIYVAICGMLIAFPDSQTYPNNYVWFYLPLNPY